MGVSVEVGNQVARAALLLLALMLTMLSTGCEQLFGGFKRYTFLEPSDLVIGESIAATTKRFGYFKVTEKINVALPEDTTNVQLLVFDSAAWEDAQPRTLIFRNDRLAGLLDEPASAAEINVFNAYVDQKRQSGAWSYIKAEQIKLERFVRVNSAADDPYTREWMTFRRLAFERLEKNQSTEAEYEYALAQKRRELYQSMESLSIQRQAAWAQDQAARAQVFQSIVAGFQQAQSRRVSCTTHSIGSTAYTDCY